MSRRFLFALLLALATQSVSAAEPAPADVDRLLRVMKVETLMAEMQQQMTLAQEAAILAAFDKVGSESERASMQAFMARTQTKVNERLSWPVLAPIMRKVYAQVYTQQEVDAMITFYGSATGAEILRKSPQASVRMMQEMQPIMQDMLAELKDEIDAKLALSKP